METRKYNLAFYILSTIVRITDLVSTRLILLLKAPFLETRIGKYLRI